MPLLTPSFNDVENSVGIYKIALSFASDAEEEARSIFQFCNHYEVSCYWYRSNVVRQSGLDVFDCMRFVYATSSNVVILNSPGYRASAATRFEFENIMKRSCEGQIHILSLGGSELITAGGNIFQASFTADNIIKLLLEVRS